MNEDIAKELENRFDSKESTISITWEEFRQLRDRDRDIEMEKMRSHVSFLRNVVHSMSYADNSELLIEMANSTLKATPDSLYTRLEDEMEGMEEFYADLRKERDQLFEMVETYSEATILDDKMLRPYLVGLNAQRLEIEHVV